MMHGTVDSLLFAGRAWPGRCFVPASSAQIWSPMLPLPFLPLLLAVVLASPMVGHASAETGDAFPWIRTKGTTFVNPDGEPVILKGCNVGNWLLLEMWMLTVNHGQFQDQYSFEKNLAERFGDEERHRLMELFREKWITPRDFEIIRSFGFNVIRLPFNYRLLEDDDRPFVLKPDAFKWLDRAIEMAEDAGLYVILDMHAVPGSQSIDHPSGRVGQNLLWDDPVYATRTAWLWKQIAERYRDRSSVAGYDVINEPYGDFSTDIRPRLREIFEEIYKAIRKVDDKHVVFAPAPLWGGLGFYGNPHDNGWKYVAFTEHHYPGLFGSDPSPQTHGDFIYRTLPGKQADLESVQTPMLIGEWNPVFEHLGGGNLMRRYFDEYAKYGWAATIWSYKILHRKGGVITDNWYMVSNAEPLRELDFETATLDEIEDYFKWFGQMEYVIDEPMRLALTRPDPVDLKLPAPPPPMRAAPHHDDLVDWTATDIGDTLAGGQKVEADGAMTVYGGGRNIWHDSDEFRMVWRQMDGDFVFTARVDDLLRTDRHAKAGLMARASLRQDSAHLLLHAFPGGQVAVGWRDADSGMMTQEEADSKGWPAYLRLTRRDGTFLAEHSVDGEAWAGIGAPLAIEAIGSVCYVGFAVLSHNAETLTSALFSEIKIEPLDP